jgi:uncharacterized protein
MDFFDRETELAQLERWWVGERPELITVYGRRQVGKTELLVRFFADKPTIYFYADRQLVGDHLRAFTEQVLLLTDDAVLRLQPFASWEAALTYVLRLAAERRIALVIDEFSYAVDADPALPSVIQRLWDSARREATRAFIILCTSFAEATERHFQIDGPLYRRRTRELRLAPFTYREAARFFSHWSPVEQLQGWGLVGGVPSYLNALQGADLGAAAQEHLLDKGAPLYREAETLLAQEVRGVGPALLRAMLAAIAYGCTEPNQIAQRVGRPITGLSGALRFLVDYGLVERRWPYTVANPERTRQTHYRVADNYLAWWFRFVLPNRSALEQGQGAYVWRHKVVPHLGEYMGARFEEACRQYIRLTPERWAQPIPELGHWWRASDEIDIVGHDNGRVILAGEVKWTNEPVDLGTLRTLQRRVALLPDVAPECQYLLFSRAGFTPALAAIRDPAVVLIGIGEMLR